MRFGLLVLENMRKTGGAALMPRPLNTWRRGTVPFALLLVSAASLFGKTGDLKIHLILHEVGEEHYSIETAPDGLILNTTFEYSDRGNQRTTTAVLQMKADYTPLLLDVKGRPAPVDLKTKSDLPAHYFTVLGPSPFAIQMAMMRYWLANGKPALLQNLKGDARADPLRIELVGHDTIKVSGKTVQLDRYTIANLMFGREILWMNADGDLAAAMTFAGGLPMEAIRAEYATSLPELYRSGVAQEMANLAAIGKTVPPEQSGAFAIAGARLVDGTGAVPIEDSVVIIRNGRIAAAGARGKTTIPKGMAIVDARGKTLLPGLWEMHTHFSGIEFGPATLAAGITTARDCGGEFEYLVAQRDAVEKSHAVSPRLLLAGLVDAGGPKAFGHVTAETPEEGRAVVNRYHAAAFQQIKLYTFLQSDVIRAITAEAHRLGMTVTGHVPQVFNAYEGVEAGMDQINHLNYVTTIMRAPGSARTDPIDPTSDAARKAIAFLKEHGTVVDPTASWGEMAGHSKEVLIETFEPGIEKAPLVLNAKFRGMGSGTTAEQMRTRGASTLAVIAALHKAGVTIVPGSDTGLVGYGLLRELQLYVQAGMSPMEAIQCATIVSARAMKLDQDTGSIEAGKRADMILVNGNPLEQFSDIRKVAKVVTNGRLFDSGKLWQSVGFHP